MNNYTAQRNQNASSYSRGGHGCQVYQNGVRCGETKTLTIIQEFKQLYEDKMRIIDQEGSGDCGVQAKINLQQDWIRDLTEQNEMLVRAVEELEQEATERVLSLEEKLKQSSKCACETIKLLEEREKKILDLEKQIEVISKQSSCSQDSGKDNQLSILKQSMLDMRDALTAEVADKHDTIVMLRRDVQILEDQCRKADQQTHFKDDIIKELRKELKQLKSEKPKITEYFIESKSFSDNCNQTTYISTDRLISNLTRKCEQIRSNLDLDVHPKYINSCSRPTTSIKEKGFKSIDNTCQNIPTTSHYDESENIVKIIAKDMCTNTQNMFKEKITCNASTATRQPLIRKLKDIYTNTENIINLGLSEAWTNTIPPLIALSRREATTNTKPRSILKHQATCTDSALFNRGLFNNEPILSGSALDVVITYTQSETKLYDPGSVKPMAKSNICDDNIYKTTGRRFCLKEEEKGAQTCKKACIETGYDFNEFIFEEGRERKSKIRKNRKTKIPMPINKLPKKRPCRNTVLDDNDNCKNVKRPKRAIPTDNNSIQSYTSYCNSCSGFVSYQPHRTRIIIDNLDDLYTHPTYSKTKQNKSDEKRDATVSRKAPANYYPKNTSSKDTDSNYPNRKNNGYNQSKQMNAQRSSHSFTTHLRSKSSNPKTSINYPNDDSRNKNQTYLISNNPRSYNDTRNWQQNSLTPKKQSNQTKQSEASNYRGTNYTFRSQISPKDRQQKRRKMDYTDNSFESSTLTSDKFKDDDEENERLISNDFGHALKRQHGRTATSTLNKDKSNDFFEERNFREGIRNTSSKTSLAKFETESLYDDELNDKLNKAHTESFYTNRNMKHFYPLTSSEINFRTMQDRIENEVMPDWITLSENDNGEVVLMNQHIVELIEEVFDKETQITDMHDLISFSVKTLMTVLKSLNVLEKRITKINIKDLKAKIHNLEQENEDLRLAVKKATDELENLDKLTKSYVIDKERLQTCCQNYEDKISLLETEKDQERRNLQECSRQFENRISCLVAEKLKIIQEYQCCTEEYSSKEKKYLEQCCEFEEKQKISAETIINLEIELNKINNSNRDHCCMIKNLEVKIEELTADCCKPPKQTVAIETDQFKKANKGLNTAKRKCISVATQSRGVNFDDKTDHYYDIQVVKGVPATFSSPSSTSGSELKSKKVDILDATFTDLKENFGRFMEKDYEVDEAKKRITELEEELQQAWRDKEKEVECARCCREQEIVNLKEVINSLMKSLDNERQRSENLQKAVDLYLNSISVLQESEEQLKKEMSDQRVTISNLQDALVAAKHSLEEHRQKANQDYINMLQVIEQLRDENLVLEVDLFYYFQDIEMYEMRVLKYQQLLRDLQGQCYKIHGEVQSLENQKVQQTAFVDDLSEQLSECQDELRHLFNVLTEEQSLVENESITLTGHIMTLQTEMCALSQKLAVTIQCLENEKQNNNVLEYQLNIREHESSCLTNEVYMMKEKLRQATNEIITHQSKIISLQNKLHEYEKSITLLDEESEMCQNNIQYCFKNLKDVQLNLDKRNKEYDMLKIEYSKEVGITSNLRIELHQARELYNEELVKYQHTIKHLQNDLEKGNELHAKEIEEYLQSVHNLQEKLKEFEIKYKNTEEELSFAHNKLVEASEIEVKLRGDHVEMLTELNGKINGYMNEQERLISVINNLEDRMSSLSEDIDRKNDQIAAMKINLAAIQNSNVDQKQLFQEEICNLKNEINTLIQKQGVLKSENDKLQAQVSKYHTVASKNEEKGKLMVQELKQCLTELQTIQGDKEFLLQKNEQLAHEIQSLQDACQSKTESVVTLEMELNDTKCIRDTLCNESRNVINNVKVWLQEQRKINVELNNKIKQKNVLISQMNQEKIILRNKIKQMSSCGCTPSQGSGYPKSRTPPSTFSYRPHTPPMSGPSWTSYGSTESASCSSDSEHDITDVAPLGTPQVWIHRVESLTEKLQRKNLFWKSKMDEHDFVVSKDK